MTVENIILDKIVIHELSRNDLSRDVSVNYGVKLEILSGHVLQCFRDRLNSAIGNDSKSIELKVSHTDGASCFQLVKNIIDYDTLLFIKESGKLANSLSAILEKNRTVPDGVLIVFSGTACDPKKRIIGIIKAEMHSGFSRNSGSGELEFIKNLLLTPNTKLYKIGIFLEDDATENKWRVFVHDDKITSNDKLAAAKYFYHDFLGCDFLEENAILTLKFYKATGGFINGLPCEIENKIDLNTALITYLHSNKNAIQIAEFCTDYLEEELHDDYYNYMESKGIPNISIIKNLDFVSKSMNYRKITFSENVKMTIPSPVFEDMVGIDTIDGGTDSNGDAIKWTQITIKGQILKQE